MRVKTFTLIFSCLLAVTSVSAQRSFLSNYGISANVGLTGVGATASVALGKHFNARVGFGVMPYTYKYTMDEISLDLSRFGDYGDLVVNQDIDLKAKLKVPAAHVLVDYNPFKGGMGAFHITVGIYTGGDQLFHVSGQLTDIDGLRQQAEDIYPVVGDEINFSDIKVEVGDVNVALSDKGSAEAYMKVNALRPYFGIGWGNAIPRGRVGFRFDLGAMYHGKPTITSPNVEGDLNKVEGAEDFNKIISKVKFWPQISFQLTFRLLKDKVAPAK